MKHQEEDMAKEMPLFKDATFWLGKICILPYTAEELDSIGCLGFDMRHNKDFAEKYMQKLLEHRYLIDEHKHIAFADLNLKLYREVLQQPDLTQIPDWITSVDKKDKGANLNSIKAHIVKMYQNMQRPTMDNVSDYKDGR